MSIISTPTTCGFVLSNSAWTSDFVAYVDAKGRAQCMQLSFEDKEAEWLAWQNGGGSGGGSPFIALTGDWNGDNAYTTITADGTAELTPGIHTNGLLYIFNSGGSHTFTITSGPNSQAFTIPNGGSSITYDVVNGKLVFTQHDGLSNIVKYVVLPTPAAPTAGTGVDDTGDTYNFTPTPGYAATAHEYNLKSAGYVSCTSTDISVGDIEAVDGDLLIRVTAVAGVSNSGAVFTPAISFTSAIDADATAFIAASGTSDTTMQASINTLVRGLKAIDSWDDLELGHVYSGTSPYLNLKDTTKHLPTAHGGLSVGANGIIYNGTDAYLDADLIPSRDFLANELTEVVYLRDIAAHGWLRGVFDGTAYDASIIGDASTPATAVYLSNDGSNILFNVPISDNSGIFAFSVGNKFGLSRDMFMSNGKLKFYKLNTAISIDRRPTVKEYFGGYSSYGTLSSPISAVSSLHLIFKKSKDIGTLKQIQELVKEFVFSTGRDYAGDTNTPLPNTNTAWVAENSSIFDEGLYNGFLKMWDISDTQDMVGFYKKSVNHALGGETQFVRSTDKGAHFTETNLLVDGNPIWAAGFSIGQSPTGRRFIAYIDDYTTGSLSPNAQEFNVAYCDDDSHKFTLAQTVVKNVGQDIIFSSPGRMFTTKDGYLRFGFYEVASGLVTLNFVESQDNGLTWTKLGSTYKLFQSDGSGGFSDAGRPSTPITEEFNIIATDSLKMNLISVIRTAHDTSSALPIFVRSSDGGDTWSYIDLSHYWFHALGPTWSPVDLVLRNGYVWAITANRHSDGKRKYAKALAADAFNNTGWVETDGAEYYGYTHGSYNDFGYDNFFTVGTKLYTAWYDYSPLTNPLVAGMDKRCLIGITKLDD